MGGGLQNGSLSRWHLHRCHYCINVMYYTKPVGMSKQRWNWRRPTRDHTIPKCKARNVPNNIVICCRLCNHTKGSMGYEEFFDWMKSNQPWPPVWRLGRII